MQGNSRENTENKQYLTLNAMELQTRLRRFLEAKGLSYNEFEQAVGLSNSMAYKLNENIRKKTLTRISLAFPDLNTDWLLYGEGEMLRPSASVTQSVVGNNNTNNNNYNSSDNTASLIRIIEQQQQTIAKLAEMLSKKSG